MGFGVRIASGNSQGRKPDDERHRLRRGREKLRMNFIVTREKTRFEAAPRVFRFRFAVKKELVFGSLPKERTKT